MAESPQGTAEPEKARKQDGAGVNHPTRGSESSRGNAEPQAAEDSGHVEHVRRTIQGTAGPIEIEEVSGTAAPDGAR
ncbi:hypothetical protein [Sphingomonas jatrophae]|uniref:Uncharacterized protein n=1 Tax=Sphingomonas jatrophae TaxID=1166337 RepID=A0A1I6MA50_9SPHN|nr:hypothetical protein [Sphingomonas jatrophae]SFS12604.1 hypothetical protein SAMN05192580_3778 [Sphingomonas jatrophae]